MHSQLDDVAEIRQFIIDVVIARAEQSGIEQSDIVSLGDDQSLVEAGFLDSLDFVDLLATIEEKYGIEIDLSSYKPGYFATIGGLVAIVSGFQKHSGLLTGDVEEGQNKQ